MPRPRITDNPKPIHVNLDAMTLELLELIGRASPVGKPTRSAMIRTAVDEFIKIRMADAKIREFVESFRAQPVLELHRKPGRAAKRNE